MSLNLSEHPFFPLKESISQSNLGKWLYGDPLMKWLEIIHRKIWYFLGKKNLVQAISSSCHTTGMDLPGPLMPPVSIIHHSR